MASKSFAEDVIQQMIDSMTGRKQAHFESELEQAHDLYDKALRSFALSKVHNRETSEDLVQDTFLKTWQYLLTGREITYMRAFLYHILKNLIVDEYRRHKTVSLDLLLGKGYAPGVDQTDAMIETLDSRQIPELIEQLSPAYQKVLRLRYLEGQSLQEISAITRQRSNTVAVQLHRGLVKLQSLYNHVPLTAH